MVRFRSDFLWQARKMQKSGKSVPKTNFCPPYYNEGTSLPLENKRETIMKVRFKNLIGGYTGQADDSVIYFHPGMNRYIVRRKPVHKINSGNNRFAAICNSLSQLPLSPAYVEDFKLYHKLYNRLPPNRERQLPAWNNLWKKMMWNMQRIYGTELIGITYADIIGNQLPCICVKAAVEAGLLPKVKGWETMVAQM